MESIGLVAFLMFAGAAIIHSLLLSLQTWEHRRYVRSCMRDLGRHRATGHAAVFVPCKGIDVSLKGNLRAMLCQDYDDYEVTFVVESIDDSACDVIRRTIAAHPTVPARLLVAGEAVQSGQKVHNLRAATARLSPQVQYLAFLDSDARPRPEWLRVMIKDLCKRDTGAVTGYRWFTPARRSLANHLLYSMNCGIMSLLGKTSHYLVWGGSWGIRREVFDSIGLHDGWSGTLSDDLTASRLLRGARRRVRFTPACVVASPLDYSLATMFTFVRRQYMMGKLYTRKWWMFGIAMTTFVSAAWLVTLAVLGHGLIYGSPPAWIPASVFTLLYLLSMHRGKLRQDLVGTYFPDRQSELRQAGRFDVWASPVAGLVAWLGVLGSLFGREVTWRGIRYRVLKDGRAETVWRETAVAENLKIHQQLDLPATEDTFYTKAG